MTDPLEAAARTAEGRAYAPYPENASYGVTICAERAAVCAAVAGGARSFRQAVVVSDSDPPAAPCGAGRQVLVEFGDFEVSAAGARRTIRWRLAELLPAAFSREQPA